MKIHFCDLPQIKIYSHNLKLKKTNWDRYQICKNIYLTKTYDKAIKIENKLR